MRKRLTYANVTATLALFFALSGGAFAASHYLINSTRQISPKVLKALKGDVGVPGSAGAAGATGSQGKDGLQGVKGETGPEGKEGAEGKKGEPGSATAEGKEGKPGAPGPEGKEGKPGAAGSEGKEGAKGAEGLKGEKGERGLEGKQGPPPKLTVLEAFGAGETSVKPGEAGISEASCPEGDQVISGGFSIQGPVPNEEVSEALTERKGWLVEVANPSKTETISVEAIAYCAKAGEAVAGAQVGPAARASTLAARRQRRAARAH